MSFATLRRKPGEVPEAYVEDANESRKVLQDVGIPVTCVPNNMRFIGAQEMWDQYNASLDGNQRAPLNYLLYMEGCPYCRKVFPELLGAAWIAFCRDNDGPYYVVSSNTLKGQPFEQEMRAVFGVSTFPAIVRVRPGGQVSKYSSERTVEGLLRWYDRRLTDAPPAATNERKSRLSGKVTSRQLA
jgi:hypothetical protein